MAQRYMMATKACHAPSGNDVSSERPDLCIIDQEDATHYVGNWVTGLGLVGVRFPKETTRELTDEERERWDGVQLVVGDGARFGGTISIT